MANYNFNCLQVYDAGGYFMMSPTEDNGWKIVVSAEDGLKKDDASAYVASASTVLFPGPGPGLGSGETRSHMLSFIYIPP